VLPAPTHKNREERGHGPYAKQREAYRKAEIGVPDQKAEIVKGLAVILAADHARDHPVEIDLTAEGFGDLLATSAGPNATRAMRISRIPRMARVRMGAGSGVMRLAGGGDQRQCVRGIEPAVVERAAGDDALEPRIVGMKQGAHLVERGETAARNHRD
jgi:hypothetical protein